MCIWFRQSCRHLPTTVLWSDSGRIPTTLVATPLDLMPTAVDLMPVIDDDNVVDDSDKRWSMCILEDMMMTGSDRFGSALSFVVAIG